MKSNSKNKLFFIKTTIVVVFFTTFASLYTQSSILSFDSLYPKTWYEKSLNSLISTWQLLEACNNNKNEEEMILMCDIILGKLTFAECCIQKIKDENIPLLAEDYEYLIYIKERIQDLLKKIVVTEKLQDIVSFCEGVLPPLRATGTNSFNPMFRLIFTRGPLSKKSWKWVPDCSKAKVGLKLGPQLTRKTS